MKRFCQILLSLGVAAVSASGATSPGYTNITIVTAPGPIDAKVFVNQGTFNAVYPLGAGLPFDFQNTEYFLNQGTMVGAPGFSFDLTNPDGTGLPTGTFLNDRDGSIDAEPASDIGGPYLLINATNIINRGLLSADTFGIVRLTGQDVNLSRGSIRLNPLLSFSTSFVSSNWFNPELGVFDLDWGTGNIGLDTQDILFMGNNVTYVTTPRYALTNANGFQFYNAMTVYQPSSHVFTNKVNDTNYVIQAVFISNSDTNLDVDVSFSRFDVLQNVREVAVSFSTSTTNIFGGAETRQMYLIDRLGVDTNYNVFSNIVTGTTYRPSNYEITRLPDQSFLIGRSRANETLRSDLFTRFYNENFPSGLVYSNNIVTNFYSGYDAFVAALTTAVPPVNDASPTNLSGRVDINANNLNLQNAKIRAEGIVNINAKHLVSTDGTLIESPQLYYQLGSTNGLLRLRNLAKKDVSRLFGQLEIFSAIWTNQVFIPTNGATAARRGAALAGAGGGLGEIEVEAACPPGHTPLLSDFLGEPCGDGTGGNTGGGGGTGGGTTDTGGTQVDVIFHILLVNSSLQSRTPVELNGLRTSAKSTVLGDRIAVTDTLNVDAENLTIDGTLAMGSIFDVLGQTGVKPRLQDWTATNFPNLKNLTNNGYIVIPGALVLGADRATPYDSVTVTGTNAAAGHSYWVKQFDNSGLIFGGLALESSTTVDLFLDKAPIRIDADSAKLENGRIQTGGRVRLNAKTVRMRNHQITSQSTVSLAVTDNLSDAGPGSQVRVNTRFGFDLLTKPTTGDLLGTSFESAPTANSEAAHIWAGEDRGATKAGFVNNVAIGRLALNGDVGSAFYFEGAGDKNGLYVDFLELSPSIANDLENSLSIADNLTIYFAATSASAEELDGALNGRLRWVKDFAGANSSVDVLLRDGRTISVNRALRESLRIDSDGDGIANGQDQFPFDGASSVRIEWVTSPAPKAVLHWEAAAQKVYFVEASDSLTSGTWSTLGSVTNSSDIVETLRFEDSVSADKPRRLYRIKSNE